jgi:hypothetical protein
MNGAKIDEKDINFIDEQFSPASVRWDLTTTIKAVEAEYRRATSLHGCFNSTHEGWAVIKEEVDELWDGVKKNDNKKLLREEAIQIAAMAIRFCTDI